MQLTTEQIQRITAGAAYTEEQNGAICFHRFTKEQETVYQTQHPDFFHKTLATAGIRLEFQTNSTSLHIETDITPASSRTFFNFDLYQDQIKIGELGSKTTNSGHFSASFDLQPGEKQIRLYFPWSVAAKLTCLSLSDGATLRPLRHAHTMLIYGDSITHGYDAFSPSLSYASLLADALDAVAYNKGIGGETFFPALAEQSDAVCPDYISVAYGTNDWSRSDKETMEQTASAFFAALSQRNPQAKIFALTPIWRADWESPSRVGSFLDLPAMFERITKPFPNVQVIHGFSFVPQQTELFQDRFLHPNDAGFAHYFTNLYKEIQPYL